jgi:hypothetical protein
VPTDTPTNTPPPPPTETPVPTNTFPPLITDTVAPTLPQLAVPPTFPPPPTSAFSATPTKVPVCANGAPKDSWILLVDNGTRKVQKVAVDGIVTTLPPGGQMSLYLTSKGTHHVKVGGTTYTYTAIPSCSSQVLTISPQS